MLLILKDTDVVILAALYVDSKVLYNTTTTTHEAQDYWIRLTVQQIRNLFESHYLDALVCIPRKDNVADALTKQSVALELKLELI